MRTINLFCPDCLEEVEMVDNLHSIVQCTNCGLQGIADEEEFLTEDAANDEAMRRERLSHGLDEGIPAF